MNLKHKKTFFWLIGVSVAGAVLAGVYIYDQHDTGLRVTFFDIGQGDSALVRTPSHQNILIDAGPDTTVLSKLGKTLPFYDRHIDLIVLTHCHADHEGGLAAVLERYDVGQVIWSGVGDTSSGCVAWQSVSAQKNVPVRVVAAGKEYAFGTTTLDILYPINYESIADSKDLNATSLVSRLVYQNASFLFTGDAPAGIEEKLLQQQSLTLKSDVLKVGHHGSRYSSSVEFLRAVHPRYAVISVGAGNSYGHPHQSTLLRLKNLGTRIFRTDQTGDINCWSNGKAVVCGP